MTKHENNVSSYSIDINVTILRSKKLKSHIKINTILPTPLQRSVVKVIGGLNAFYTQETVTHCSTEKVNEAPKSQKNQIVCKTYLWSF